MRGLEGCAGEEGRSSDAEIAGAVTLGWRTLGCDEGSGVELLPRSNPSTLTERFDKMPLSFLIFGSRFDRRCQIKLLICGTQPRHHNPRVGGSSPSSATNHQ